MRSPCCVSVSPPLTFECQEICMKLGMYIMTHETVSTAYFVNPPIHLCLYVYFRIVARQRLSKHVPAAINTCNNRGIVGRNRFICGPCLIRGESVGLYVYPLIVAR
jgi:hypothetical protein